ncbi:Type 1 glutamine amidotransferase-like domain-containing protein [Planococcus lenghuensis]|uniref:Peptidase S51 dipeptidase E n=1 Tax=Planococcus lenghuensis TaxID=2213202 RepID=A0A1Q2KYM2_9BACL|nr:Type 1 glutamine amidotransferase-like domain-containing protein [Planococcus lenghuensis]AQQ53301.1 peptidase S51 dipeptidase E [Planococcus lenghuensis]
MKPTQLFLFGGSPPFTDRLGKKFSEAALALGGKVGIIFIERDGWESYMERYTNVLERYGISTFSFFPLRTEATAELLADVDQCGGLVIGGGETERYQDVIVDTPIGRLIQDKYRNGTPVAGFSAGALISPAHCVIPPVDTPKNEQLFLNGLGLLQDCVISVHYAKWQEKANLHRAMVKTASVAGIGIDDGAGVRFRNGQIAETEGSQVVVFKKEGAEIEEDHADIDRIVD